uniref:Uncharacterized protein n=1 Tax=Parascaris equorum TaxID=6256 RepID=A0A914S8W7_PAREQ
MYRIAKVFSELWYAEATYFMSDYALIRHLIKFHLLFTCWFFPYLLSDYALTKQLEEVSNRFKEGQVKLTEMEAKVEKLQTESDSKGLYLLFLSMKWKRFKYAVVLRHEIKRKRKM